MTTFTNKWCLWYHDPNNADYSLESYIRIMEVETPADFWNIVEAISLEAWKSGMFFLMRDGYRPLWDAPENDNGGAWSMKVDAAQTQEVLIDCMVHCLAQSVLKDHNDTVVGVTVSPKGNFHIIKIWNTKKTINDKKLFTEKLRTRFGDSIAYKAHNMRPK